MARKQFCEISPLTYEIALKKEIFRRHLKDFLSREKIATEKSAGKLEHVIYSHRLNMLKKGAGIDPVLQENKAVNIDISSRAINGVLVHPGEVFSFWKLIGPTTEKRGYKKGRVIINNELVPGTGGGLCNLANTISVATLHTPLDIVEEHRHSDALAPDPGKRTPLSAGTSVVYNTQDFRFKNNTNQIFQVLTWCEGEENFIEIRSDKSIDTYYEIVEEDHHFSKEGDKYYRVSKIYRITKDRSSDKQLAKDLYWDNHSRVMFDPKFIPKDQLRPTN